MTAQKVHTQKIEKLKLLDFVSMEKIEQGYFLKESVPPAKDCYHIYEKYHNYTCVIKSGDEVVGFVCTMPLKKNIYEKIRDGIVHEATVGADDLDIKSGYIYLASVALNPAHRTFQNVKRLYNAYVEHLRSMVAGGLVIKEVMADCITKEGAKIAQNILKMKPYKFTKHNSMIYLSGGETLLKLIKEQ